MIEETFTASDFEIRKMVKSKIRKGHKHNVLMGYRCPRCDRLIGLLTHGSMNECECGLLLTLCGNGMKCSLGEE
jgi:hypothetical protein